VVFSPYYAEGVTMGKVICENRDRIAYATLNRPEALNPKSTQ